MSDEEAGDIITITGITLCTTKVYRWCKKDRDGKYRPITIDDPESAIFSPTLPPSPEKEWDAVIVSGPEEYYKAMIEGGPPDRNDLLDGEIAEVIPIRLEEDK